MPPESGKDAREPGIALVVRVTPEIVEVHRASRLDHASRLGLRAPRLGIGDVPAGLTAVELVCTLLNDGGGVIESFGWPGAPEENAEKADPETGDFIAVPVRFEVFEMRLLLPAGHDTRYLQFARVEAVNERWQRRSLATFDLKPGQPGPPPQFPVPPGGPTNPLPLPGYIIDWRSRWELRFPANVRNPRAAVLPHGYVKDTRTLVYKGHPDTSIDIVIMGDGFQDSELPRYDLYADLLAANLPTIPPFSSFVERINVYSVRVVSEESGITNCPAAGVRRLTYFGTEGFWDGRGSPGYVGTGQTALIYDAAALIVPWEYVNMVYMIANCRVHGGGRASRNQQTAFLTLSKDETEASQTFFVHSAAHEAGHVLAHLNEEYNPCKKFDPTDETPNQVTQAQVDDGDVWWKTPTLALPNELDGSGNLVNVHKHGDPVTNPTNCQPLSPDYLDRLGLFWGCLHGDDPPVDLNNHPSQGFCDDRGARFYRPMARCKMRRREYAFCRVCAKLLTDVLRAAAP